MYKLESWFVFKVGKGLQARALRVKGITKDGKKIRTYRPIGGVLWFSVDAVRPATVEEIKLSLRIDKEAP